MRYLIYNIRNLLSCVVAFIQWKTSFHRNRMIARNKRVSFMLLTTSVSIMLFQIEKLLLVEIKSDFQGSYDKQNLTLAEGSFHKFHMKRPIV